MKLINNKHKLLIELREELNKKEDLPQWLIFNIINHAEKLINNNNLKVYEMEAIEKEIN